MRVLVITRHAISNYGSLLQAIATQEAIEKLGHTCGIIDYIRNGESYQKQEITLLKQKPKWNRNLLKRMLYLGIKMPGAYFAGKAFRKWQKEYLNLTKLYTSNEELARDIPEADIYLTGSDQVWGPMQDGSYDDAYLLAFARGRKKVSYAASFGRTEMTAQLKEHFSQRLAQYEKITVREDSAAELVESMGHAVEQVLDPTLLFDKTYWSRYVDENKAGKYILIYQIHNDPALGEYARKVAKAKKLKLIRLSPSIHHVMRNGSLKYLPDIRGFLTYIKHAECVITDSFHGTAFAINLNTPFVEVLPNNKTSGRNLSILNLSGLTDRILKNTNDVALAYKPIDYSAVNERMRLSREQSTAILAQMLTEDGCI